MNNKTLTETIERTLATERKMLEEERVSLLKGDMVKAALAYSKANEARRERHEALTTAANI